MASFTDDSRALSQFNPYIQQIPVDDYVRVGLEKQQQYNQGVQKAQSQIDSVTSLPVIMPEQKQYLQERIGQLKNSLSRVVGQDFSQSQLVNQIGGLTSQIANDPIIQSAVTSAARYQSESSKMDKARADGKSDPANEYHFQKAFQNWVNSGDVKAQFSGEYVPHTEIKKTLVDAVNSLATHPDEQIQDFPFVMKDGQIVKDPKTGAPIPDYVMIQKTMKGVDANRIQAAINAAFGPAEMRQLAIDGEYEYRGAGKEQMKSVTDASYQQKLGQTNDIIKALELEKLTDPTNKAKQAQLDFQISEQKKGAESLVRQYQNDIAYLDKGDLDTYKGEVYKANWMSNATHGLQWSQVSLTYKDNPYYKAHLEEQKNERESAMFLAEYGRGGFKDRALNQKDQELELKAYELGLKTKNAPGGLPGVVLGEAVPGNIDQEGLPKTTQSTVQQNIQTNEDRATAARLKTASVLIPGSTVMTQGADGKTVLTFANEKAKAEAEVKIKQWTDDFVNNKPIPPLAKDYIQKYAGIQQDITQAKAGLANIQKEADRIAKVDEIFAPVGGLVLNNSSRGINNEHLTPTQIGEFVHKLDKVYKNVQTGVIPGGTPSQPATILTTRQYDETAGNQAFITPVEKQLGDVYRKMQKGEHMTPDEQLIASRIVKAEQIYKNNRAALTNRNAYIDSRLDAQSTVNQPTSFGIGTATPIAKQAMERLVGNLTDYLQQQGAGNLPGGSTVEDVGKMYGKEGTVMSLEVRGNGTSYVKMTNPSVGKAVRIPLTEELRGQLFPEAPNVLAPIKKVLAMTDGTTTDIQHNGAMSAYPLISPNITKYGLKYHVEQGAPGEYQLKMFIGLPGAPRGQYKELYFDYPGMMSEKELINALSTLNDKDIDNMLSQQK